MFDKLEDIVLRLEEVLNQLQEPDVANDQNRFRKLMKEQAELTPIRERRKEWEARHFPASMRKRSSKCRRKNFLLTGRY